MTGRGKAGNPPIRPVTPLDATLSSRPVARRRYFVPRSFGPGAVADIRSRVQPIRALLAAVDETPDIQIKLHRLYSLQGDDIRLLLQDCEEYESISYRSDERPPPPDPTWGFAVFVTVYDYDSREQLPLAMENWLRVQKCSLDSDVQGGFILPAFADEAWQRFKLDVIEDQEALDGASDDRVRAEFRALVRAKDLSDDEEQLLPPARNQACLVLDADAITMLAGLEFPEDGHVAFGDKKVKVIDGVWQRPENSNGKYRGTGQLQIDALLRFYRLLTSGVNAGYMEGMHFEEKRWGSVI